MKPADIAALTLIEEFVHTTKEKGVEMTLSSLVVLTFIMAARADKEDGAKALEELAEVAMKWSMKWADKGDVVINSEVVEKAKEILRGTADEWPDTIGH